MRSVGEIGLDTPILYGVRMDVGVAIGVFWFMLFYFLFDGETQLGFFLGFFMTWLTVWLVGTIGLAIFLVPLAGFILYAMWRR